MNIGKLRHRGILYFPQGIKVVDGVEVQTMYQVQAYGWP
jgi:hypothetical protein